MRIAIYQPRYFPQLHYFNRMCDVDVFVFLDAAQYTKTLVHNTFSDEQKRHKSFQTDTPIKFPSGITYLTVPVKHNGLHTIAYTKIDYSQNWVKKHLEQIKIAYKNAPYFKQVFPYITYILKRQYNSLAALNITTTVASLLYLLDSPVTFDTNIPESVNIKLAEVNTIRLKQIVLSTKINVPRPEGLQKGTEWTIALCKKLLATEYLHGETAKSGYMDLSSYITHGITPVVQKWVCREYPQRFTKQHGFLANLSILDLLFNVSITEAREILGMKNAL